MGARRMGWMTALAAAVLLALPGEGRAQVAWDTPLLVPPAPPPGLGVYLMDAYGGKLGVMGAWRASYWNFQVRAGLAEDSPGGDLAVFGGVDYSGAVTRDTRDFPLDIDWIVGAGASIGDGAWLSFPAGLVVGHTFVAENVRFTPYLSPRVMLDAFLDTGGEDGSDMDLDFAADLGLDFRFSNALLFRFGGTLGDRDGVAIGVVF